MPTSTRLVPNPAHPANSADGRQRILQAAFPLFAERGYYGVSISEVAESAGLVKSSIYHHFENKETLYLAVLSEACARANQAMEAGAQGKDWKTRLHNAVLTLAKNLGPRSYALNLLLEGISHVPISHDRTMVDGQRVLRETLMRVLIREISNGIAAGDLRRIDPFSAALGLLGLIASAQAPFLKSDEERINFVFDLFLLGTVRRKK